jgi:hypothetical protein
VFLIIFKEEVESGDYMHRVEVLSKEDMRFFQNGWIDIVNMETGDMLTEDGDWVEVPSAEESENVEKYTLSS